MYPQGVQSPQALTNRGAIRSHTRTRRFLGTFLRSVPLLVARRGVIPWDNARFLSRLNAIPVRQPRTEQVVPNGTTSESKPTDRNAHITLSSGVRRYNCLDRSVSLPTHSVQPDDDGAVSPPLPTTLLVRSRGLWCSLREGA